MFFDTVDARKLPNGKTLTTKATFFDAVLEIPEAPALTLVTRQFGEHFTIGDRFQLSLDSGVVTTATVTAFAAGRGMDTNDSYVGALAVIRPDQVRYFTRDVYAASRTALTESAPAKQSTILDTNVDATTRSRITDTLRKAMSRVQPALSLWTLVRVDVESFRLADGALRYHAIGVWGGPRRSDVAMFVAWLDDRFAIQKSSCSCPLGEAFPDTLVNVLTLGPGRTGIVLSDFAPGYFTGFSLYEYQERNGIPKWILLQTLGAGG